MIIMVRSQPPEAEGLTIQIYAFTDLTNTTAYENLISEIMNHILASVKYFDLQIFTTTIIDPVNINVNGSIDKK